ncbi:16S rRNA (uracil(1498)-N(3))-methyltransferase [Ketobacter sp. MCCC 1A13808]|uniref:16S rRNA (uracil(1498)-N(3))-methyltransferase n=1 Tax=Ketobacter sp. MCCC 1A13808 TaxID=2602738 RepID=UPI000F254ADD|nr:16S rRNA (uracil(1498)-N(3))-methyltransferase [Ketobacter sp. MCCC 1A13808]MVF13158.1 16S rRNA (uracil(1498)-N(3))-methyltransferase [Ketobacter sp. MCCC 1A13808]RLP54804.1 MAG: 16S rRNA (uracil(1498)-N(3))-methyltransferase [Ketobacter sp.]
MNLILLQPHELPSGHHGPVILDDQRARHITQVIRPSVGDRLRVGLVDGAMGLATVTQCIDPQRVELEVTLATLNTPPPAPLPVTLLLALPRPKVLRRVLQTCTAMGIKQIYLINSYRVDKSYWQTPLLSDESVHTQLLAGLEQARDTILPRVHLRSRFKPFVEDELPQLAENKLCLTAHPADTATPCPTAVRQQTLLAIGPEGGFITYEVDKLAQAGFEAITLGPRILKVETAIAALISRLF